MGFAFLSKRVKIFPKFNQALQGLSSEMPEYFCAVEKNFIFCPRLFTKNLETAVIQGYGSDEVEDKTSFTTFGRAFYINACRYRKHESRMTCGASCFTKVGKLHVLQSIAASPFVYRVPTFCLPNTLFTVSKALTSIVFPKRARKILTLL